MLTNTKINRTIPESKAVANNASKKPYKNLKEIAIQPKLTVDRPGDNYEQEADHVADRVMTMPEPVGNQNTCMDCRDNVIQTQPLFRMITPFVQRQTEEEEEEPIQTKPDSIADETASSSIESNINNTAGQGSPLPAGIRNFMESHFGTDFSHVRVHNDMNSTWLNRQLNAQAFTRASDIYFNSGKYNPDSSSGKHLIAHELAHVVQQSGDNISQEKISREEESEDTCSGLERDPESMSIYIARYHCRLQFGREIVVLRTECDPPSASSTMVCDLYLESGAHLRVIYNSQRNRASVIENPSSGGRSACAYSYSCIDGRTITLNLIHC